MGRNKKANKIDWGRPLKEIAAGHGIEPVDEMFKELNTRMEVTGMEVKDFEHLLDDYELFADGDKRFLRPKLKHRLNIIFELAQYFHPKLRSTETKGQVDYNFNVTIRQFDSAPAEPKRIDVVDVTPKLIEG